MWKWLFQRSADKARPLIGAPRHRRRKVYTADSGYVYGYYYEGYRVAEDAGGSAAEYVFQVSADRANWFPVSVYLGDETLREWERGHRRDLDSTERYAIVKMALFGAFDEREHPEQMRADVRVGAGQIEEILDRLGID